MKRLHIVTTIRVAPEVWAALHEMALARAVAQGGRPSASGVITDLVSADLMRRQSEGQPDER